MFKIVSYRFIFFMLPLLSPVAAYTQTESYSWHNVAMGGGGFVSGIIPSKTQQGLIYARTDVGGAYRWDNNNNEWIPLLDWVSENELGFLGVESIATDPNNPNKLYLLVGTSYFNDGKTAILKSDDYGESFSIIDVSAQFKAHGNGMGRQTGEKLQVDPNKSTILYCGTRANGLFKSSDEGSSWTHVTSLDVSATDNGNGISFVVPDPSTGTLGAETQTLIVGVSEAGENIYRTDNAGQTFYPVTGAPTSLMPQRAALSGDRNLYITYANAAGPWDIRGAGAIWRYDLQSGAWTDVTPAGFSGAFGGISIDPNNPDRVVASSLNTYMLQDVGFGDRIFLSKDAGNTWTDVVARGFDLDPNGISWVDGHAIHWAGSIEFDPFDTKKAWVVSGNGVFRTDDIDASTNIWKFHVKGLEETVPLNLVSISNGPLVSVIGDYDGFRHASITDYAPIHMPRMGSTTGLAVASLNPRIMLRVGEKMFYSTDMGIAWTECAKNGTKGNVAISADGSVFLHCPENSNVTYRSLNKGTSWEPVTGMNVSGARPVADPVDAAKFYIYNSQNGNGNLYISTNAGASFSASGSAGTFGSKVMQAVPGLEGDLWIPLYGNGLTRSVDSGTNFSRLANVSYCGAVGFGKSATGKSFPTIYIWGTIGNVRGIYRSTNEGVTWTRVNDDAHEYGGPANGQFVIGDMNIFGRVYMSTAGRGIVYGESDQACNPITVVPHIKVNEGEMQQTSLVPFSTGSTVVFSPEAAVGGTWSWSGPNGFTSVAREITLTDLDLDQAGVYALQYINAAGCESGIQTFTIAMPAIKAKSITITSETNAFNINEKDGTLQLGAVVTPSDALQQVNWIITLNDSFASISGDGLLTSLQDGKITVRATAADGSGVFNQVQVTITNQSIVAGEQTMDPDFRIYPNPVSTKVIIGNSRQINKIVVTNAMGEIVETHLNNNQSTIILNVEKISPGLYILGLQDKNNFRHYFRVIKK